MKLHELGARRPTEQVASVLRNQSGRNLDFDALGSKQASTMLSKVSSLIREHRSAPSFHYSEKNPTYLQLVMMEQALKSRIRSLREQMATTTSGQQPAAGAAMRDPKAKAVMDKVSRGQSLTADEQNTMNQIALAKEQKISEKYMGFKKLEKSIAKRGDVRDPGAVAAAIGRKKYGKERFQKAAAAGKKLGERRINEASELQQAQVVLASQDMVDRIQGMMEDISEMQFKDLPALANSIKNDMGPEQASQFQGQAAAALSQLLSSLQTGKTELESAQGVLTGQAPVVPGQADAGAAMEPAVSGDIEADLDLDANIDVDDEEEEVTGDLGRERR